MQDFLEAVIFGFKEIRHPLVMKFALVSGAAVTLFWLLVGLMFWDGIIAFSSSFIDLVPFSMIRSNAAWMLSTFLWFQLVLITFALIFAFGGNFIVERFSKERYASFSLFVFMGSALFWAAVWFVEGSMIHAEFVKLVTWLPFETIEKSLAALMGVYFIYNAIIVTMIFISSSFSSKILEEIRSTYHRYDDIIEDSEIKTLKYTLKDTAIFLVISIIAIPLLFIPVINFFVQMALWVWLVKDTFVFDSATMLMKDANKATFKEHRAALYGISLVTALFNFVPVFNLFGPFFGELAMYDYVRQLHRNKRLDS